MTPGEEIGIKIDQTLTQDATGTLVMLELEAIGLDRAKTEVSVQYVDHNLLQEDNKNPDDHAFLLSAAQRFGLWYSRPGNGVSHPLHQEYFGVPGKTLLGSDSHTCAAGAIGMLAIGAGGLDVAQAIAGYPFHLTMPEVWGVKLEGELPDWVSAKDVILEMLRRHGVSEAVNCVVEYYGPGIETLSAMDRHVIANMGAELGATTSVFPADETVKRFFRAQGRGDDFVSMVADDGADYDQHETIDLGTLEPLIAMPTSPGNVRPVREVAGEDIHQAYVGSSANPGYRDFAVVAETLDGRRVPEDVSLDLNPASRQILSTLARDSRLVKLIQGGGRLHQAGCNGCIGMGQAPATDTMSLRTVPRNFPGRSGTQEDKVCLVSPETAVASALKGCITDPRTLSDEGIEYPRIDEPTDPVRDIGMFVAPLPPDEAQTVSLDMGPNIEELPALEPLPDSLEVPVVLKVGDDVSTDEILPAGARILPLRSNIPKISQYTFVDLAPDYHDTAMARRDSGGHAIVGGLNYGQGSSREHAALAPRYLGLRVVVAKSFARIHRQNLVNFGVLPLIWEDPGDYDAISDGDTLKATRLHEALRGGERVELRDASGDRKMRAKHDLSSREVDVLLAGGRVNLIRQELESAAQ